MPKPSAKELEYPDEVQDILGTPPSWKIRYGIGFIFLILVTLLLFSWFIKYPEIITSEVILTSTQPPVSLIPHSTGKIDRLFVKNNEIVKPDQLLLIIDNPADYNDIQHLKDILDSSILPINKFSQLKNIHENFNIGELQPHFSNLMKSYKSYSFLITNDSIKKKITILENQIANHLRLKKNLEQQVQLHEQDLQINREQLDADSILFSKGIISIKEFKNQKSAFIQKMNNYLQIYNSLINEEIQINELKKILGDLMTQRKKQYAQLKTELEQDLAQLKSQIETWEYKYVLKSPIKGKVLFHQIWSNFQNVSTDEAVMTIIPENNVLKCRAKLPLMGAGKVQPHQKVQIKLYNYPYQEFGYVSGFVKRISQVPYKNNYILEIDLPQGLKTNYGINLESKNKMYGTAEVITEDLRLAERFFHQIRFIFK